MRNRYTILAEKYCSQVLCENVNQGDWPALQDWEFMGKISADGESALYKSKPGTRRIVTYVWFNKQVKLHNNLGPALLTRDSRTWYVNGMRHRLDGPAEIYSGRNGWVAYYINDKSYIKDDFEKKIREIKTLQQTQDQYGVDLNDLMESTDGWPRTIEVSGLWKFKLIGKVSPDGESRAYTLVDFDTEGNPVGVYWFNKQEQFHNNFGPAIEYPSYKGWYINGKRHRLDGPAEIRDENRGTYYINNVEYSKKDFDKKVKEMEALKKAGEPYGVDLNDLQEGNGGWPQKITRGGFDYDFTGEVSPDGQSGKYKIFFTGHYWFNKQGLYHYNFGPAANVPYYKAWWVNGKRHRLDGPAIEKITNNFKTRTSSNETAYFINDVEYSKEDFDKKVKEIKGLQQAGEPYGVDLNDLEEGNKDWPKVVDFKGYIRIGRSVKVDFTGEISPDGQSGKYKRGMDVLWLNKQGDLHYNFGPAYDGLTGHKLWYVNGKLHRLDGPAVITFTGVEDYYINGVHYSENDYYKKAKEIKALQQAGEPYGVDLNDLEEQNTQGEWPATGQLGAGEYTFTGKVSPDGQSGLYNDRYTASYYWLNKKGILHNNFGPAFFNQRERTWYVNGKLHRLDGPADIIKGRGRRPSQETHYIDGIEYSKEDYDKKIKEIKVLQQTKEPYGVDLNDLMEGTNDGWPPDFYGIKYTGEVSSDGESKEIKDYLGTYWINKQGEYHNNEQPAMQYNNGDFYWIVNGVYHNLNGPSVVEKNPPVRSYHINGKEYSKEDFDKKVQQIKDLQQAGEPYGVDLNDL